jgi:hypothetical protein
VLQHTYNKVQASHQLHVAAAPSYQLVHRHRIRRSNSTLLAVPHCTLIMLLPPRCCCCCQISNNCGMLHYTSGGQFKVPVVIRGPGGVGRQLGAGNSRILLRKQLARSSSRLRFKHIQPWWRGPHLDM